MVRDAAKWALVTEFQPVCPRKLKGYAQNLKGLGYARTRTGGFAQGVKGFALGLLNCWC